jgi:hypothetical protein
MKDLGVFSGRVVETVGGSYGYKLHTREKE